LSLRPSRDSTSQDVTTSPTARPPRLDRALDHAVHSDVTKLLADGVIVTAALLCSYLVRFDGDIPGAYKTQFLLVVPWVAMLQVVSNYLWSVYAYLWRFTSLEDGKALLGALVGSFVLLILSRQFVAAPGLAAFRIPYGVLAVFPVLAGAGMLLLRVVRRLFYRQRIHQDRSAPASFDSKRRRILLLGAGEAGQLLARELEGRPEFEIVGFLDDDRRLRNKRIHRYEVLGSLADLEATVSQRSVNEIFLCMPTAPREVMASVAMRSKSLGVGSYSIPSLSELLKGTLRISDLRPVTPESLLFRPEIPAPGNDPELFDTYEGRRLLITGAGGSIGSELVRQLKDFKPSLLILLDKDENSLFEIGVEIKEVFEGEVVEIVADIRDPGRLSRVFEAQRPEVVFHAAAYKHVPMMEHNPSEAVLNNVIGTRNLLEAAIAHSVGRFVFVSSDKAVNPTNVMGATKRICELLVQSRVDSGHSTRLCCVRFGNVLGSRGSVVTLFTKRIAQGKSLQITDPEINRFFMTIPEAVQLVIQAGSLGDRGEIFVLDMGEPVKIVDLARQVVEMSGLDPDRDVEIEYIGLRPGEKLTEELMRADETGDPNARYSKLLVVRTAANRSWAHLEPVLAELEAAARDGHPAAEIHDLLAFLDIGYRPPEDRVRV